MRSDDFLKAHLATLAWRDGYSEGLNGMLACAFAIRDRVRAGFYGGSWTDVLSHHDEWSSTTPTSSGQGALPDPNNYAVRSLLQQIDGVFSGSQTNTITLSQDPISNAFVFTDGQRSLSTASQPPLYYGRLDQITNPWFLEEICRKSEQHKRVAQVGMLTFFT